jgi:anti-sigma factor RsiW
MDHQNCHDLLTSLSDYIDGDLPPGLCAEIEKHMAGCENCRIVVDTLRKTVTLYQEVQEPAELPAGMRERLYRRLELDEFLNLNHSEPSE